MNRDPAAHHAPDADAAAYLAGELRPGDHAAFEGHLLECDECWHEVHTARRGRSYALRAREAAPPALRARLLATLPPALDRRAGRLRVRLAVAAALLVGMLAGAVGGVLATREADEQPAAIAAAVEEYRAGRLPGSQIPDTPAPDLSSLHLERTAAANGRLDDLPVTAYAYRDDAGRRLIVYTGQRPFPVPYGPERHSAGLWVGRDSGVTILCGRRPRHTLIVGEDEQLVRAAATVLQIG